MARIGVITGSGTYALPDFSGGEPREVATRFGPARVTEGEFAGVEVVHVSRHWEGHHRLSNHVDHRANVTALKEAGVDAVIGITVCGACDPSLELGTLVVFDDLHFLVNRLPDGQICTLYDTPGEPGRGHWIFEGPFSRGRPAACSTARARPATPCATAGATATSTARGSTRGPRSGMLAQAGVTAVSQTAGPETVLCGEAELPYGLVGYATDYANGVQDEATPVEELMRLIGASGATFASTLTAAVPKLAAADLAPVGTHFRF
jgi:purine nucleoside phosphorylase